MAFESKLRRELFSTLFLVVVLLVMDGFCNSVSGSCREVKDETVEKVRSCEALCDSLTGKCEIRAAVLLSMDTITNASLHSVMPVLLLAEEEIRRTHLLPENLTITWMTYDDRCDASYALISAIDAYADNCTHVYFGPVCEYALASISRITKFLGNTGTPLLTTGGLSYDFVLNKTNCNHEYHMLTRVGLVGFKDIAHFIIELMHRYQWRRLLIVNEPEGQSSVSGKYTCHLMMKTFAQIMKNDTNLMYTSWDTTQTRGKNFSANLEQELGMSYTNINGVAYCWFLSATPITMSAVLTRARFR